MKWSTRSAAALAAASALLAGAAAAAGPSGTVSITLPGETATLKDGPGADVARRNCVTCHSADYIYMQPPLTEAQWRGEVTKMKKVMKAPIADGDIDAIVDYLMSQNGKR